MVALRLRRVTGLEGRANDVVLAPPARRPDPTPHDLPIQTLVFFGGDVQDYPEVMAAHRDNRNYQRWNLESTARSLSHNFPSKHIVIVRPSRFMERIEAMYWLDGGHAGGKNTWVTSRSLLETLTRLDINVFVHVSPYQVQDEGRPWIGREEKAFTSLLRQLGCRVQRYLHEAPGAPQNLHMHFEVLDKFKRLQDSAPAPPLSDSDDDDT